MNGSTYNYKGNVGFEAHTQSDGTEEMSQTEWKRRKQTIKSTAERQLARRKQGAGEALCTVLRYAADTRRVTFITQLHGAKLLFRSSQYLN
jgi:hypothetical protein